MSVCRPLGMLENVVLNVGSYQVPVNFLDLEEGSRRSMILGRPFLATASAIIDVKDGVLTFRIGENRVEYRMNKTLCGPSEVHFVGRIDVIDKVVEEVSEGEMSSRESFKEYSDDTFDKDICKLLHTCSKISNHDSLVQGSEHDRFESLMGANSEKTEGEEFKMQKVDLKPLPSNLRYAFLGLNSTYP